jgi:hypothetical protein
MKSLHLHFPWGKPQQACEVFRVLETQDSTHFLLSRLKSWLAWLILVWFNKLLKGTAQRYLSSVRNHSTRLSTLHFKTTYIFSGFARVGGAKDLRDFSHEVFNFWVEAEIIPFTADNNPGHCQISCCCQWYFKFLKANSLWNCKRHMQFNMHGDL